MYTNPVTDSIELNIEAEQCIVCGKRTTFCCSRCRRVFYCSQTCQKVDWRSHKLICHEPMELPPDEPPPVTTQLFSLPNASRTKPLLPIYERASNAFKDALMGRFGSIVLAYEWFEANSSGYIDYEQFETTMKPYIEDAVVTREFFTALDKSGKGRISLSEFLSEAAKKINPLLDSNSPSSPKTPVKPQSKADLGKKPTDPAKLPPGRRALRQAALLAFRNGRYDDAIISSQQALGITSVSLKATQISAHPDNLVELLLLLRSFLVTKNVPKGDLLLDIVQRTVPFDAPNEAFPFDHYPAHVTATLLCSIADVFDQYKKSVIAEKYFCRYLSLVEEYFGSESLVYSDALTLVSAFYIRTSNLERALETTELAKRIRVKNLPQVHARVADSVCNHALVLKAAKRFDQAIEEFQIAKAQRVELFGSNSLPVADIDYTIGSSFLNWAAQDGSSEKIENAKLALTAAHASRLRLLGPSNEDTLNAAEGLRKIQLIKNPPSAKKDRVVKIHDLYNREPREIMSQSHTPASSSVTGASRSIPGEFDEVLPGKGPKNLSSFPPSGASSRMNTGRTFESKKSVPNEWSEHATPLPTNRTNESNGDGQKSIPNEFDEPVSAALMESPKLPAAEIVERLKVPTNLRFSDPSPFGRYAASYGMDELVRSLSILETKILDYVDFDFSDSLPKQLTPTPIPVTAAMGLVYLKRMLELESLSTSNDPVMLENFFSQMKRHQESVKYVFNVLNTINRNLNGLSTPALTL